VNRPIMNVQPGPKEIEIKFSAFDAATVEAVIETINKLHYESHTVGKLLTEYGDPTKSAAYRYGVRLPKNVDAEPFTNWLVDQLRTLQLNDQATWEVNQIPAFERTGK
jgi:hypothetical protein